MYVSHKMNENKKIVYVETKIVARITISLTKSKSLTAYQASSQLM